MLGSKGHGARLWDKHLGDSAKKTCLRLLDLSQLPALDHVHVISSENKDSFCRKQSTKLAVILRDLLTANHQSKLSAMADYPTAPSTPLGPVSSANIDNLTNDPVVPAAPHKQIKDHTVLQIRTKSSTLPAPSSHSHHHIQTGRVTKPKPPSILRSSSTNLNPKKRSSTLHVRFEDIPSRRRSMAPSPTTPPRTPPPSFEEDTSGFKEAPSTPDIMPEPLTPPPAPHVCMTDYSDECSKCKRVEQWNLDATLAIRQKPKPKESSAKASDSELRDMRIVAQGLQAKPSDKGDL